MRHLLCVLTQSLYNSVMVVGVLTHTEPVQQCDGCQCVNSEPVQQCDGCRCVNTQSLYNSVMVVGVLTHTDNHHPVVQAL